MLSSILNSKRAIHVNIAIMRAFVNLRALLATHKDLAKKLEELEKKYDGQFKIVFEAIRRLMLPQTAAQDGSLKQDLPCGCLESFFNLVCVFRNVHIQIIHFIANLPVISRLICPILQI